MNSIDFTSMREGLEEQLQEAIRVHQEGARDPGWRLRLIVKHLAEQMETDAKFAERYSSYSADNEGRAIMQDIHDRAQAALDAGPRPMAPLPELKMFFLTDRARECEVTDTPLPNPILLPYAPFRIDIEAFTLWGEGEGIWNLTFEFYDEEGNFIWRHDKGDLELPFPGAPNWHGRLCWSLDVMFDRADVQDVVLLVAGQEMGRVEVAYRDSRASG